MPFRGFKDFDDCTTKITKSGKSPDAAKRICGKLQSQEEGKVIELSIHTSDAQCIKDLMDKGMSRDEATKKCYEEIEEEEAIIGAAALDYADGEILEDDGKGSTEVIKIEDAAKYPWSKCVNDQMGKGYSSKAATKICASIRNKSKGFGKRVSLEDYKSAIEAKKYLMGQIVVRFAQKDKLFIKAFLLSATVNLNRWGVTRESIPGTINSFIGKPLVLTEDFGHPDFQDPSITHALRFQEDFRIGNIVDVVPDRDGENYFAVIEITDEDAKRAFTTGDLPLYVSPAIAKLDFDEPEDAISNWTGIHLAIVDDPAFTVKHATITGRCTGDEQTCLLQLRKAKVEKEGYGACSFCAFKKLTSILPAEEIAKRESVITDLQKSNENNEKAVSSLVSNSQSSSSVDKLTTNTESPNSNSANVEKVEATATPTTPAKQDAEIAKSNADTPQPIQRRNVTVTPDNSGSFYEGELHSLRVQNELNQKVIAGLKEQLSLTTKELEAARNEGRRAAIETVITAEIYPNETERQEKISELIQTGLSAEQVRDIYKPLSDLRKSTAAQEPQNFYQARSESSGKVPLRNNPEIKTARRDNREENIALEVNGLIVREGGL